METWRRELSRTALAGGLAILALFAASSNGAHAQAVSVVGVWRSCEPSLGCGIVFNFMPNGRVIKQYLLLGGTVTGYGRYRREGDDLRIVWTRVSPKRICGPSAEADDQHSQRCAQPTESDIGGPLEFDGFNALVWKISGKPPLRLERRED